MEITTVLAMVAALIPILKVIGIVDRWAHALGMTKVMDAQLRHFAAIPGNKLAPIANAIADAVDEGKDEKLLNDAANVAGEVQGAKSVVDVIGRVTQPPFVASSPVAHGPTP